MVSSLEYYDKLKDLLVNHPDLEGTFKSNRFEINSKKTFSFNTNKKPIYTISGIVDSYNENTKIKLYIKTYFIGEMINILQIVGGLIFLFLYYYDSFYPFLERKGEFVNIASVAIIVIGIYGIYRDYNRKQKGVLQMENIFNQLK